MTKLRTELPITTDEMIIRLDEIRHVVNLFNKQWPLHVVNMTGWKLPIVLIDDSKDRRTIPVTKIVSEEAVNEGVHALRQFDRIRDQDPSTAFRYPSIVYVSKSFTKEVDHINGLKDKLVERMKTLNERQRNVYARRAWPGVSTLQVYRHISCFDETPRKALFSWIGRTVSISRALTADECIDSIKRTETMVPSAIKADDWKAYIKKEIMDVKSLDSSSGEFIKMRPVAPHPRLMLYMDECVEKASHVVFANIPTFVLAPEGSSTEACNIVDLKEFDFSTIQKRKKRKDAKKYTPVVPRLFLYFRPF